MLTVHHLENSRSQRILWLLEELGVEYEIKQYSRDPDTNLAPAELLAIHPLGKSQEQQRCPQEKSQRAAKAFERPVPTRKLVDP